MCEKSYDELDFTDDFLFCRILMANEDLCVELVEMITGRKVRGILLDDGAHKIFLCADGTMDDCSDKMRDFLDYIAGKETDGELSSRIQKEVSKSREHKEWRLDYMTLLEKYREKFDEGQKVGRKAGIEEGRLEGEEERKALQAEVDSLRVELERLKALVTV